MRRVLVTGVAGMIGSHLLDELLTRGDFVIGMDNLSYGNTANIQHNFSNERFRFYRVDIRDIDTLRILARDIDWIVHLAAVKKIGEKQSSMDTLRVNATGTEHVLEVAKTWGTRVLFASTSDVYGTSNDIPLNEEGDLLIGPSIVRRWSYAVSKLYGEQLCFAYYKDYNVPVVILRYFGGFSPRSSFLWSGGHIPIFIDAILGDQEVIVHADGRQTRSMAYVSDLVTGTLLAMERSEAIGEIINIGSDQELSVLDTAHLIHRLANTGKVLRLKFVPFADVFGQGYKDISRRIPDLSKARRLLGYAPTTDIEDAILKTIESVQAYRRNVV